MKTRILKRKRAVVAAAVLAAGVLGVQLAWSGGLPGRSDDPAKSARLALNPEKAARLAYAERIRREAHAKASTHPRPDPVAARPEPRPDPLPPTGIVPITPPFPAQTYMINDQGWQTIEGGRRIAVYAGALTRDRSQGLVIVEVASLPKPGGELNDDQVRSFTPFPTPTKDGAVEIVSAQGQRLTLRAESGKTLVFDVLKGGWVSN